MEDRPAYVPIYEGTINALRKLGPEAAYEVLCLLDDYVFSGIEPEGDGVAPALFEAIRGPIDRSLERLRAQREAGRASAAKRKASRSTATNTKETESVVDATESVVDGTESIVDETVPVVNETVNETENIEGEGKGEGDTPSPKRGRGGLGGSGDPPRSKSFTRPSLDDVMAYGRDWCRDRASPPDYFRAESFMAYYDRNGWKVGKNPMRDWKAAVRGWILRDHPELEGRGAQSDLFDRYN